MGIFDKLLGKGKKDSENERMNQHIILVERIKKGEGLRLHLYTCPAGKESIGYGHNIEDNGITKEIAESILESDITTATLDLFQNFAWVKDLDYVRQGVLIEMVFNMGIKRFKGFKKMLVACQKGEWDKAADEMLDSQWHKQIKKRAEALAEIMRKGK